MNRTIFTEDIANNKLLVEREFDGTVEQVWKAWTEPELLDEWWAPKPWKANTKFMDFRTGGHWFYYMVGPDSSRHYCRADYTSVIPNKSFIGDDLFCDEDGNKTTDLPRMHWEAEFTATNRGTKVNLIVSFASKEDMEKIVAMGFKEGFSMAHENLDALLLSLK